MNPRALCIWGHLRRRFFEVLRSSLAVVEEDPAEHVEWLTLFALEHARSVLKGLGQAEARHAARRQEAF